MKFNEKLTILRKEKGMNMTEFANLLGTSKQVIARYERGENTPKITTVAHYAEVLGVSLQYLINEDCNDRTGNKTITPEEANLSEGEKMFNIISHNRIKVIYPKGWRRQWHPTPVLLPGKSHGRRSLVGCSPWGR